MLEKKTKFIIEGEVMRQHVMRIIDCSQHFEVTIKPIKKQRTPKQNSAIHVYFPLLAEALNDAGFEIVRTLSEKEYDIPWTGELVHELLWRPLQEARLGTRSSTELSTGEVSVVFNILARNLSDKFGVYVPFPSLRR